MASNRIPEVYVLWHPDCDIGEMLARRIYSWLRPGNGLGLNVLFRSSTAPGGPSGGLPLPLPLKSSASNMQIVLPLIDAHMVADFAWRYWLAELAEPAGIDRRIMPIALDTTAYNVPNQLRTLNFLRPSGLTPPPAPDEVPVAYESASRSLLKQLTEALCRLMLGRQQACANQASDEEVFPQLKIFLSHAKVDGTGPARRLRDYIYSQTQLTAFYDENDIAYGSAFSKVLSRNLSSPETAALIAVRTAQYAARPWCRREVALFRSPRPLDPPANDRWLLYPALVVDSLGPGSQTWGISELGNASCIRWDDSVSDQEEQIVTTLLRDVMLGAFHIALGATIESQPNQIVINWLPDPITLLQIERVRSDSDLNVVYPGRGFSGMELATFEDCFPNVTLRSFDEVLK